MHVRSSVRLSDIVYYHIGGVAKTVIDVSSVEDIQEALQYCQEQHLSPIQIVGLGCNLLLPDTQFDGVFLHLQSGHHAVKVTNTSITCFAGTELDEVIHVAFVHNLSGLAWAGGLPSTVGGAVRGNAGCFGSETKDIVSSVTFIDMNDKNFTLRTFKNKQCNFAYRSSYFKKHPNIIIVSVTFKLKLAVPLQMQEQKHIYQKNIQYRQSHHPLEYPSCGSVFKNIVKKTNVEKILAVWPDIRELSNTKWHGKVSMAYIIGRLGFSGYTVGGAQVSEKHNNYISNIDHAKAKDVQEIIKTISNKFKTIFGFMPELEVEIL